MSHKMQVENSITQTINESYKHLRLQSLVVVQDKWLVIYFIQLLENMFFFNHLHYYIRQNVCVEKGTNDF